MSALQLLSMPKVGEQDAMLQKKYAVDSLTTSTWYDVRDTLYGDIFQITPLFDMLRAKGKIKQRAPKGSYFEIPIAYKKLKQNQKFFGRGAEFSREEGEFATRLQYNVRNFGDSITRYWEDEIQNKGEAQILDYVEEVLANHKGSIEETLHESLWESAGPLSINALPDLITTTPEVGTVGGLDRSKNTYVRNVVDDMTGVSLSASMVSRMETFYNTLSRLKGRAARRTPDLIITTQTLHEKYVGIARALGQYQINPEQSKDNRVNLGMGDAMFKNAEMFWDPNCPEGQMYFLNTDTLEFPYDPDWWMQMTEWKSEATTLERYAQIVTRCNLVCNNFNKNGVMFNMLTA
ncbi:phage major capsid protein [bacterium]|nr:phage major capsid protein [bacterium]